MITYGIGVINVIKELLEAHPKVSQLWYIDDIVSGDTFPHTLSHLDNIMVWGPPRGYFPDPTKSVLGVLETNLSFTESFFSGKGITIFTRRRYLGGYIGDARPHSHWLG